MNMKKITLFFAAIFVSAMCFSQITVENLWEFSVQKENQVSVADDIKNGIAISPDGTKLYLSTRASNSNQVAQYDATNGTRLGYLPALAGFASAYGGDVAVDSNGAIYASNVIISAAALMVAKWDNATATPTVFISTTAHGGSSSNRIGYGMDVFVDVNGDGFLLMHKNGTAEIKYWQITNNLPVSQDPTTITMPTAMTDLYARISIVDKDHFWIDGNVARPYYCSMTRGAADYSAPTEISNTLFGYRTDVNVGVGGITEFSLSGKRFAVFAANNHSAVAPWNLQPGHMALLQELKATGIAVEGDVIATLPTAGMGKTSDASHFVESAVYVNGHDAYIYSMGGFNGITAHKVSAPLPPATKTFTVTVPNGTEKVYIVGGFTDKAWDVTDPYELTATANPNEFTGTFACEDGVEYKYLCEKGDYLYQEATSVAPLTAAGNHTYSASDNVMYWFAMPKLKLNVTVAAKKGLPANLFVKGSWDGWANPVELIKTGDTYAGVVNDTVYADSQYKYFSNDPSADNWEARPDNRWSIYPTMNDEIADFTVALPMSGTYTVGTTVGADFTTLKDAVDALNTKGMNGDVVFEISSDISEPANIGLGVDTKGFGITIRPDADEDRTITFTKTTDNKSPSGHLVIGYTDITAAWSDANTIATNNVTIDGYAVGGSTRRLKFTTSNVSITGSKLTVIVGACENTTIKNCIYENQSIGGSAQGIGMVARKGTAIEVSPNGVTIDNNIITSLASGSGQGINTTSSGTLTTAKTQGLVIKNNTIKAQGRAAWFYYINGMEFYSNEVHLTQLGNANTVNYGVWTGTGAVGTFNIYNNKFIETSTMEASASGTLGMRTLSLASGTVNNIYNNMFAGLDKKSTATATVNLTYVFFGGSGHISHNTFYMPKITAKTSAGYYNAVQLSFANPAINNNIFISEEDEMVNAFYSAVSTDSINNNRYYNRAGTTKSLIVAGTTYSTLADFQAANPTKDIDSKSVNVDFVDAAAGDLRISGFSVQAGELAVPLLPSVTTDMFGTLRTGSDRDLTYAGAHESVTPFIFTTTAKVETIARIMRTNTGIQIEFEGEANIELYNISGMMIDKTRAIDSYSRNLDNGIYIIRINGKATKFIK